jgi:hypothetical protein
LTDSRAPRTVLLPAELLQQIDRWAAEQDGAPSQSEAVCELLKIGMAVGPSVRSADKPGSRTARKMAADQIDRMNDPSASPEEITSRKRRLLKGPEEFRDQRVDRPDESEQ